METPVEMVPATCWGVETPPSTAIERESLLGNIVSPHSISNSLHTNGVTILSRNIKLVIGTLGLFSLSMEAFHKLLAIVLSSSPPIGRGLPPAQLGYAFGSSAIASITIQATCFPAFERIFGYTIIYRVSLLVVCSTIFFSPSIGLFGGKLVLWIELISTLTVKTVATFACEYVRSTTRTVFHF
jgi:hypothetical protein